MTTEERYQLFKNVTVIIGPRGSGLSGNMFWTNPMPSDCEHRVKTLEFIGDCSTAEEMVTGRGQPYVTHCPWVRGWPFDYHHMSFQSESRKDTLIIDINDFVDALDEMLCSVASCPKGLR
jgi:hypothetical protein